MLSLSSMSRILSSFKVISLLRFLTLVIALIFWLLSCCLSYWSVLTSANRCSSSSISRKRVSLSVSALASVFEHRFISSTRVYAWVPPKMVSWIFSKTSSNRFFSAVTHQSSFSIFLFIFVVEPYAFFVSERVWFSFFLSDLISCVVSFSLTAFCSKDCYRCSTSS